MNISDVNYARLAIARMPVELLGSKIQRIKAVKDTIAVGLWEAITLQALAMLFTAGETEHGGYTFKARRVAYTDTFHLWITHHAGSRVKVSDASIDQVIQAVRYTLFD